MAAQPGIGLTIDWPGNRPADFSRVFMVAAEIDDFKPVFKQIGEEVVAPSIKMNFEIGGRPPWQALAASTLARKSALGLSSDILVASGALKADAGDAGSYRYEKDFMAAAPFDTEYWIYHQKGGPKLPQRVIMSLQAQDRTAINTIFAAFVRTWVNLGARTFTGGTRGS